MSDQDKREGGSPDVESDPTLDAPAQQGQGQLRRTELTRDLARPIESIAEQRYAAVALLGRGGMGDVWLYEDVRIGREVALKRLREGIDETETAQRRFLREARVQAQIEHPSVVPVYDLGVAPDASLFFTMRRVRGRTLQDLLAALASGDRETTERFSRRRLLTAFVSVCLAVHYAHTRGVLHRDLKPGNVMFGDFGEVYVLDWGLAKLVETPGEGPSDAARPFVPSAGLTPLAPKAVVRRVKEPASPDLPGSNPGGITNAGSILGTPGYIAPEQLRLDPSLVCARSDVYSLGAILFEILTLQRLHPGGDLSRIIADTVEGTSRRPSVVAEDVSPELDALCERATRTSLESRLPTARELADGIERYLDGDRDLGLRRSLAARHARSAVEAAQRARSLVDPASEAEAHAERERAMEWVLKALALEPEQPEARGELVRLLVETPTRVPPEVDKAIDAARRTARHEGMRHAWITFAAWMLGIPAMLAIGVRQWSVAIVAFAFNLAAVVLALWMRHSKQTGPRVSLALGVSAFGTIALFSSWLGPFVFVPMAAAVTSLVFATYATRRERPIYAALGTLSVLLPFALEIFHVIPRSFEFRNGDLILHPRVLELPEGWTLLGLVITILGYGIVPTLYVGRLRDALSLAERRLFLHTWHLERLAKGPAPAPDRDARE